MNWSRVKTFLIIIFVVINVFLIAKIIERKTNYIDKNAVKTVAQILKDKNIELTIQIPEAKASYKRILIKNEDNKAQYGEENILFISLNEIKTSETKINNTNIIFEKYIGKGKNIIRSYDILIELLRKTGISNIKITGIKLGYFVDLDKYQRSLKTAEINPSWQIETSNGKKYIFDAYNAELLYEGK